MKPTKESESKPKKKTSRTVSCRVCHTHPPGKGKVVCEKCEVVWIRKEKQRKAR